MKAVSQTYRWPFETAGKAVSRDTAIGKRISGPLACSARRITDLRRLFR